MQTTRLQRILSVMEMLSTMKAHTGTLADLLGVSKRTIFRDIRSLRDAGVNVLYDNVEIGFYLPEEIMTVRRLTDDEFLAIRTLRRFCQQNLELCDLFSWASSALSKVLGRETSRARRFSEGGSVEIAPNIRCTDVAKMTCSRILSCVVKCSLHRTCCRVTLSRHENMFVTLLSPYIVRMTPDGWIVRGRSSMHRKVVTLSVSEITTIEVVNQTFAIPPRYLMKERNDRCRIAG